MPFAGPWHKDIFLPRRTALSRFDLKDEKTTFHLGLRDPINERPGFSDMLTYLHGNGARIILVESASRFARDLAVQITGHELLKRKGIELVPVDAPDHFINETPTAVMVRQILGAVSQFEKASLVEKLRKARERKRIETGRCEGRKPVPEAVVKEAKRLYRKNPRTGKR